SRVVSGQRPRFRDTPARILAAAPRLLAAPQGTRMNLQGFLDHLLKSQSATQAPGAQPSTGGSLLNAAFGKGAITGGALGLLLGKNKSTRKLATYGGLAAIGVMAYKAYGDYKTQQGNAQAAPPQTVDRLPPPQAALHSEAILRALVGAAKADGRSEERRVGKGSSCRGAPSRRNKK